MNNLQIGKYIKHALSGLSIPVFPIGQDGSNQGAAYQPPFVTYKRNAYTEESTKDGEWEGSVQVAVDVVAKTYEDMITYVTSVQTALHAAPALWNAQATKPFIVAEQTLSFGEESMDDTMTLYVCEVTVEVETE